MKLKVNLQGEWKFLLSKEKPADNAVCDDIITLPSTVQQMKKPPVTDERSAGYLTDPYRFDGYAVYERELDIPYDAESDVIFTAERTRVTSLYINGKNVGTQNSLCSPHRYDITEYINSGKFTLRLVVDNVSYPVSGGHLTSQDTQTNWLGVLGDISIIYKSKARLEKVRFFPDVENGTVKVSGSLKGAESLELSAEVNGFGKRTFTVTAENPAFVYEMNGAKLWSEHETTVYTMRVEAEGDIEEYTFGMRSFAADGTDFKLNGEKIHLRGKHDGMIFPLTGAAPTDAESWKKVLAVSKEHGINHYRFHTCCPPEAAFEAADELGIYMQPELQFWGTVEEEMNDAQRYLVEEGFRMLDEYGNHPSFFALSLGNELWGSDKRLNEILGGYKKHDPRPLYTQGSNNFQFWPSIVENDDFFSGVRFSRDRLFRGSYAMCDAPLGHLQTAAPDSSYTFDEHIRPASVSEGASEGGTIEIQYGTGVKKVSLTNSNGELIPQIPVVSHEVGQYFMYPDYSEIEKYTGVLKPHNFEIFKERLENAGLGEYADDYFKASGRFAAECYKFEIETALRSKELSGFQLLDIQDFTGQGTALVGILNSFMESKGLITPEEWRGFCSDRVVLGCLDSFVAAAGEKITMPVKLYSYTNANENDPVVKITLGDKEYMLNSVCSSKNGLFDLGEVILEMPVTEKAEKLKLTLECDSSVNSYDMWVFPEINAPDYGSTVLAKDWAAAEKALDEGKNVLYMPDEISEDKSVEGTYCTDFWNYPMFSSISKSMNKPVPVGTLGILADKEHPLFEEFPTESYSTAQWYDIITGSRTAVLDGLGLKLIVRTIDNCERNHDLGTLFEAAAGNGKLMVCTAALDRKADSLPCRQLLSSILSYMNSDKFAPAQTADIAKLREIFA